jgi:hypothetical protein
MSSRVAVVGTGPREDVDISGRSHAFGYEHASAYADEFEGRVDLAMRDTRYRDPRTT